MANEPEEGAICSQCRQRGAIVVVRGHPLCLNCFDQLNQVLERQNRSLERMMNYVTAEMEAAMGIGGLPRFPEPPPPVLHTGPMNLSHIRVSDSVVGAINTGTVQKLDVRLTQMQEQGASELAAALLQFTQAILDSDEVPNEKKRELVDQVEFVAEQTGIPAEKRNQGAFRAVLASLKQTATTIAALTVAWENLEEILQRIAS